MAVVVAAGLEAKMEREYSSLQEVHNFSQVAVTDAHNLNNLRYMLGERVTLLLAK